MDGPTIRVAEYYGQLARVTCCASEINLGNPFGNTFVTPLSMSMELHDEHACLVTYKVIEAEDCDKELMNLYIVHQLRRILDNMQAILLLDLCGSIIYCVGARTKKEKS